MKAHLMFRDRDFDPEQLIARRERDARVRDPDPKLDLKRALPWNETALRQDLGLDVVFATMAAGDQFLLDVAQVALLSGLQDVDGIRYRQSALRDCIEHENLVREIYALAVEAIVGERKNYWSYFSRSPASILSRSVEVLSMFVGHLRRLRAIAGRCRHQFRSEAFSKMFAMLQRELDDGYFDEIEHHLRRLKFKHGVLISARLGKGNKGTDYVLRKPHPDTRTFLQKLIYKPPGHTYRLHPRDESGARALSDIRDLGLNLVANAVGQSTDHVLSFFLMLRTELAFYIGCLNLKRELANLGEPTCVPDPLPPTDNRIRFSGLYDVSLALSGKRMVVANDLEADGKDIFVITGANTGGKSTFMRSIGIAQSMMQAGMFVGAERFRTPVRNGVITHYKREEDAGMESGKLDEELARMSGIVDRLQPGAMVLLNESFAATNEREGSEIARQIVTALVERGVKVIFVTHLHAFAHDLHGKRLENAMFLRAERKPDGTRTFRILQGEPLQTSYGPDLYRTIFTSEEVRRSEREIEIPERV